MAISFYDFKNLPDQSQYEVVLSEGQVVHESYKNDLRFVLYELSSFSVEIVYHMNNHKVASLSAFQNKGTFGN